MKKTLSLLVITLMVLLVGCQPDAPIYPDGIPRSNSYQPITKGSYWKYNSEFSGITATQTTTMTGATETINGKPYYVGNTVTAGQTEKTYFYHGDGKYAMRTITVDNRITMEYIYLIDNMTLGQTWTAPVTDNGTVNGAPAQIVGEVIEVGITKKVGGKTFNDVVHTKLYLQYNLLGTMETYQELNYFIAKGVGIIEISTSVLGITSATTLSSYSIK